MAIRTYHLRNGEQRYSWYWRAEDPQSGLVRDREKRGFKTQAAARRWGETKAALHPFAGESSGGDEQTVGAFAVEWFHRKKAHWAPKTRELYEQQIVDYIADPDDGLGRCALGDCDYDEIEAFAARLVTWPRLAADGKSLREPLSPSSRNAVLELLRSILNNAAEKKRWREVIKWKTIFFPEEDREDPAITDEQLQTLIGLLPGPGDYRLFVLVLRKMPFRLRELLAVEAGNCDFDANVIRVRDQATDTRGGRKKPKTRSSLREIPMDDLEPIFRELCQRTPNGPIFRTHTGAPIDADNFRERIWRSAVDAMADATTDNVLKEEIRSWRIHDLRHRWAAGALERGATVQWISKVMGHRDTWITLRYLKAEQAKIPPSVPDTNATWLLNSR